MRTHRFSLTSVWVAVILTVPLPLESQIVSWRPGSTVPLVQLTGEIFQIYSNGTYFTNYTPARTLTHFGVQGVDLGYPVVYQDKIIFLFGDTQGVYTGDVGGKTSYILAPGAGGDDSIGYISNMDLSQCHYISDVDQQLQQGNVHPNVGYGNCPVLNFYQDPAPGPQSPPFQPTVISGLSAGEDLGPFETPSGAFDWNNRLYMFYVVKVQTDAKPHFALQSILARSDQPNSQWSSTHPPTFSKLYVVSSHPAIADVNNPPPEETGGGKFIFVPPVMMDHATLSANSLLGGLPSELQNAQQVVFLFGSSWEYNRSNLYLAAFSAADVDAGTSAWFYYSGQNGSNDWSKSEQAATPLLPDQSNIGNHSVIWNDKLQRFILMYGNVQARTAATPWGPWSEPDLIFGPQSTWAQKLIHHPGQDPITRGLVSLFRSNGQPLVFQNDNGVPYAPYLIDKSTQNADGSVDVYYTMSTWDPYQVFLLKSTFQTGPVANSPMVSAASFDSSALAPNEIASIFSKGLAPTTAQAQDVNLPTTLAGVTVYVTDAAGTSSPAPLYFVSPQQINFVVPQNTATGPATITVFQGTNLLFSGTTQVRKVSPGVFAANADGQGVAAALFVAVNQAGQQNVDAAFLCGTASGSCAPAPINLNQGSGGAFLELFGTGIRNNSGLSTVAVTVGGVSCTVTYAGPQGQYPGMDQVNVQIPSRLRGRGKVAVNLWVNGRPANTVMVSFQ